VTTSDHGRPEPGRDDEVLVLFERYARTGDRDLRNELIVRHRWLAVQCAKRFSRRSVPLDDLVQVAQVGLLKAVERFDPEFGVHFATFAVPTMLGELRRHFRDSTWAVKVSRRHKDRCLDISTANERLAQRLARLPTVDEIAAELDLRPDEIRESMSAGAAYWTTSLDRPSTGADDTDAGLNEIRDLLGVDEGSLAASSVAIRAGLRTLPERERRVVFLRFFEELTQQEIADVIGVSQVHVSRLLRSALGLLRSILGDVEGEVAATFTRVP
jgi:RNA polymerase sigma-B factor